MAVAHDPIQDALERPRRYWNVDGIPEIVAGLFWLAWGAAALLPIVVPYQPLVRMQTLVVITVIGAVTLLLPRLIKRWKERVTFPRTGYVELRRPKKSVRFAVATVALVAAFGLGALALQGSRSREQWIPLALAVLLSLGLAQAGWKMRAARLALLSPAITVVGIALTVFRVGSDLAVALVLLTAGLICVTDGVLVMRSYLRAHPEPAGEQQ